MRVLETDTRFVANYPKLKQVLQTIFTLNDTDNKATALAQLKSIEMVDWDTLNADTQWALHNQKYNYFNNSPERRHLFIELATACRTLIVLFEKNNTQDDTMAYEYAYKLMAIFTDEQPLDSRTFDTIAKEANKLITHDNSDKNHPLHDALLVKLDLPPAYALQDKAGWQALIKSSGTKAFYFLGMAQKIEQKIAT